MRSRDIEEREERGGRDREETQSEKDQWYISDKKDIEESQIKKEREREFESGKEKSCLN